MTTKSTKLNAPTFGLPLLAIVGGAVVVLVVLLLAAVADRQPKYLPEVAGQPRAEIINAEVEHGDVRLPDVPGGATTCQEALDALAQRFADEDEG